ncbi:MAG TPA: hypothetical protein VFQ50_02595, partial [Flavobacterium sp.]|nr:hypothetical protein [Flavobacterium sp.]
MKTKILLCCAVLSLLTISCTKDEDNSNNIPSVMNAEEVNSNTKIDNIADDVLQIAELQSNEFEYTMRGNAENFLSTCATVSTVQAGNVWVRTVDFGDENCQLFTGNLVRGKIIITFDNDWSAATRTVSYAFDNFYHNNRHVQGNRTVVKTILANGHPNAVINLDMTITMPNGEIYHRTGTRVREFTEGYDTFFILTDNV